MDLSKEKQRGIEGKLDNMGRVTIPAAYRHKLKLCFGDEVELFLYDGFIALKPCLNK